VIATDPARLGTRPDGVGLAVGEAAPVTLAVVNHEGRTFRLGDALREGAVLVVFYRGGWCPYCNFQVRELTESYEAFRARGVTPIVVSVDRVSEAAKTGAAYGIPFPVLSDPDLELHRAFNVVFTADPELVATYQGYGIDLEAASGRTHHSYAVPSIFLVGRDGSARLPRA
jgi:peroxiredoxin